jgi:outer membrane receptor protein involved in Fe transport
MRLFVLASGIFLSTGPLCAASLEQALDEIIVTATLRQQSIIEVPASVTVLEADTLSAAGRQHFEDVLSLVPNLHWAGGTSRPRYFQIRGIGEREQYEGAPNPSVGFLIDDIDFSGVGMAATLFDVDRIEVLRGPQGTRYGANALAGLILVKGNEPARSPGYTVEAGVGDYGARSAGVVATGPVEALDSAWRLSLQQQQSDGFMRNAYLRRDDTNDRDELTARFKWQWDASESTQLDFTLLHADLENGYNGWAIDNSRVTLADEPGQDSQQATGASARLTTTAWMPYTLTAIASYVDSSSTNSFDADWGNAESWAPYTYEYFQSADRDRTASTLELRLASPDARAPGEFAWLVGSYALGLEEKGRDTLRGIYADPSDPAWDGASDDVLASDYDATNLALFSQLDQMISERWRWSAGLRIEQREATYQDRGTSGGAPLANDRRARDRMVGGQLSLSVDVSADSSAYVSLSRGYKAGGFNLGNVPAEARAFDPEYLWSAESGLKAALFEGRGYVDAAVFYQWRKDLQVRSGRQLDPANPGTYTFATDNLPNGYNAGVEASLRYALTPSFNVGASLGLLRTKASGGITEEGAPVRSREQAHAPEYSASVYADWRHHTGIVARVDVSAKDNFYFDVPTDHDMQSRSYTIANLRVGYERERWSVYAWLKNAFDEDYAVRGFYFYNEPPFLEKHLYTQLGEPRQVGVSVRWQM